VFAAAVTAPLSVTSVKVTDNKHIRINFSEAIDSDSVVLKVMKQSIDKGEFGIISINNINREGLM
jgi:hypothetical protein